jgi:lipoate synthase
MKKLLIVTLTIALIFALITCEKDDDDPDPCTCLSTYGTTAHLGMNETCTCGGTDCTACTEQTATVGGITVRKQAGVTVQQMNDAVANINTVYNDDLTSGGKNNFKNHITEIQIISGSTVTHTDTTLKVGSSATTTAISDYILDHVIQ